MRDRGPVPGMLHHRMQECACDWFSYLRTIHSRPIELEVDCAQIDFQLRLRHFVFVACSLGTGAQPVSLHARLDAIYAQTLRFAVENYATF